MTEISKHLDPDNIQNLEKKYMDEIWKLIDSKELSSKPWPLPLSSDLAFYSKDKLLGK